MLLLCNLYLQKHLMHSYHAALYVINLTKQSRGWVPSLASFISRAMTGLSSIKDVLLVPLKVSSVSTGHAPAFPLYRLTAAAAADEPGMTPLRRPWWRTRPTAPSRVALGSACPLLAARWAAARCGGAFPDTPAAACSSLLKDCQGLHLRD